MNTKQLLATLIGKGVKTPGYNMNTLHRTDGLLHNEPIQQLFANYYRLEPYEFVTSSDHEADLALLNGDIEAHHAEYLEHLNRHHCGSYHLLSELRNSLSGKCEQVRTYCLGTLLMTIHNAVREHVQQVTTAALECTSNPKMCKQLAEDYSLFVRFIVLFETKLPALSQLLSAVKSEGYPFSLWKCLHEEFVEGVIRPMTPQVVAGLCEILKERREQSFKAMLQPEEAGSSYRTDELVWAAKSTLGMLVNAHLDEKAVYTLESSKLPTNDNYSQLEKCLSEQTAELYQKHASSLVTLENWRQALSADVNVLDIVLLPSLAARLQTTCIESAQAILKTDKPLGDVDFPDRLTHDVEIEICLQALGVPA